MIDLSTLERQRTQWIRQQSKMANMLQEMERELENVKKKNIHESIILLKEKRINEIICAINAADDLIQLLVFNYKSAQLEMAIMEKQLTKWLIQEDKLSDFCSADNTMSLVKDFIGEFKRQQTK